MGVQRCCAQSPVLRRGRAQSRLRRADLPFVPRAAAAGGAPRWGSPGGTLVTMAERSTEPHDYLSKPWLASHLSEERREADLLSEVREAIFGAQDGVTSILTVVITVATATSNQYAALVPIAPFFFLPVPVALVTAIAISVVVMFCLGVAKSRLTLRNPVRSGLEIVALVLAASAGGFIFGSLLPRALGFAGIGV